MLPLSQFILFRHKIFRQFSFYGQLFGDSNDFLPDFVHNEAFQTIFRSGTSVKSVQFSFYGHGLAGAIDFLPDLGCLW